mmetsp:Transcript_14867/g.37644  ORF Transcript_14867/g.37644 Transcript_14867/m.37644 type:complete len:201 (-) Transcript_14867:871-1473(-)
MALQQRLEQLDRVGVVALECVELDRDHHRILAVRIKRVRLGQGPPRLVRAIWHGEENASDQRVRARAVGHQRRRLARSGEGLAGHLHARVGVHQRDEAFQLASDCVCLAQRVDGLLGPAGREEQRALELVGARVPIVECESPLAILERTRSLALVRPKHRHGDPWLRSASVAGQYVGAQNVELGQALSAREQQGVAIDPI